MVTTTTILFWISLSILFYCYIGYGVLVFLITGLKKSIIKKKQKIFSEEILPVTLIITAYNEEKILEQKIHNTLSIDYPADKLQATAQYRKHARNVARVGCRQ